MKEKTITVRSSERATWLARAPASPQASRPAL